MSCPMEHRFFEVEEREGEGEKERGREGGREAGRRREIIKQSDQACS